MSNHIRLTESVILGDILKEKAMFRNYLKPIALASDAGSEWKNGLAIALIGGLSSSMFLSLILVPVVYSAMDRLMKKG